jgi:hypothetical protein
MYTSSLLSQISYYTEDHEFAWGGGGGIEISKHNENTNERLKSFNNPNF